MKFECLLVSIRFLETKGFFFVFIDASPQKIKIAERMIYLSPTNIIVETIQNIYVINCNQTPPPPEQETSPGPAPSVCLSICLSCLNVLDLVRRVLQGAPVPQSCQQCNTAETAQVCIFGTTRLLNGLSILNKRRNNL